MSVQVSITKRLIPRKSRTGAVTMLPRYVVHYKDPRTGRRKEQFYERQKDAQHAQRQLTVELEQGTYIDKKEVPTIAEAFDHWYNDRQGQVRPITLAGYAQHRNYICGPLLIGTPEQRCEYTVSGKLPKRTHLQNMLGHAKLNELTTAEIRLWHKNLAEQVGSYSANRAKQHLATILALAAEDFNVRPPVMPKKLGRKGTKEKKAILVAADISRLLVAAQEDKDHGLYYAFPFLAGTRPSEQLGLLWSEVDFDKRIIRIRRIQDRKSGLVEVTKTAAGRREIPMPGILYDMLLEWKERCPRRGGELHRVFPGLGQKQKWPLPRKGGGGELSYANFRNRVWVPALKRLEMPHVTPHSARHSFVSTLQAAGVEVGLVAKLAGHASAVVTLSHYTQATRGGEGAMEALAAAFAQQPELQSLSMP